MSDIENDQCKAARCVTAARGDDADFPSTNLRSSKSKTRSANYVIVGERWYGASMRTASDGLSRPTKMLLGGKPSVSRKPASRDVLGFCGRHLRALFSGVRAANS